MGLGRPDGAGSCHESQGLRLARGRIAPRRRVQCRPSLRAGTSPVSALAQLDMLAAGRDRTSGVFISLQVDRCSSVRSRSERRQFAQCSRHAALQRPP
jgi:hypothetical protein